MPELIDRLLPASTHRRGLMLANLAREQVREVCTGATRACYDSTWSSPAHALQSGELAAFASDRLSDLAADLDLRAAAYAAYGNALRLNARFTEAKAALRNADLLAARGTGDSGLVAAILEQIATLHQDLRRFPSALALLRQAELLHEGAGRVQSVARSLVSQGIALGYSGDPTKAVATLTKAARLLEPSDARLRLAAAHNIAWFLVDMGCAEHALRCFAKADEAGFYRAFSGQPPGEARRLWLKAHILAGLNRGNEAEAVFREVRKIYLEIGQLQEAALVSLELAGLYVDSERWAKLPGLVEEILPVFERLGIEREARASRLILHALQSRDQAARLLRCVTATLRRPRHQKPA